jgi:choline dehydrogenase-like flavoprotein
MAAGSGPARPGEAARDPVLAALVDTIVPGSPTAESSSLAYPSASSVGVDRSVAELVASLPRAPREEFGRLLRAVDSRVLNLLLGSGPVRFDRLGPDARAAYLRRWSTSRLALKRRGFQAVKRLTAWAYFSAPVASGSHPLWDRIHYAPDTLPNGLPDPLAGLGPVEPTADADVGADVCVVGSGAGGSVVAARLAAVGHRVVVLEAGPWIPGLRYPRIERTAFDRLYAGRGIVTTRDSAIAILAGATAGGGTSINWMTCLPPRPEARAEWNDAAGVGGPDDRAFDQAYATVSARLRVSREASDVNASNDVLRRGAVALGMREGPDWEIIPRNALGCERRCGSCEFGCPYAARQSALTTYLADALRAGARLYCRTQADAIEIRSGRAAGVRAVYRGGARPVAVQVRAPTVVVAAGALETPALLLRSDLRSEGIGRGLRLDPTTALVGEFPTPIRSWEGPPQTVNVRRFQTSDAGAHGPWIETAPTHPGLAALATPWADAADFRRLLERLEFVATPIVLVRDVGEGRVTIDADGRARFDYRLTPRDRANLVRGLAETARILAAAGATRLLSLSAPYAEAIGGSSAVSAGALDRFVSEVERAGIREHATGLFSAHPMGSARLGRDPRTSAARPTGEVHDVGGVWIADGSALPSAPGANPMMSIFAFAERISDHLVAALADRAPSSAAG